MLVDMRGLYHDRRRLSRTLLISRPCGRDQASRRSNILIHNLASRSCREQHSPNCDTTPTLMQPGHIEAYEARARGGEKPDTARSSAFIQRCRTFSRTVFAIPQIRDSVDVKVSRLYEPASVSIDDFDIVDGNNAIQGLPPLSVMAHPCPILLGQNIRETHKVLAVGPCRQHDDVRMINRPLRGYARDATNIEHTSKSRNELVVSEPRPCSVAIFVGGSCLAACTIYCFHQWFRLTST